MDKIYECHGTPEILQSDRDKEFYGHTKKYCELEKIEMTKTKSKDYPLKDFQKFDETLQAIGKQIIDLSNYFPNKNDESKLAAEFTKFYLTQSKKPKHLQTPHLTANTISSKLDSLISLCSYSSLKHVHIMMLSDDRELLLLKIKEFKNRLK